jgi:hypothetical protein
MIVFLSGLTIKSQNMQQQVISASGDAMRSAETIIEWTLGEPVIATHTEGSIMLTQGFHQPKLVVTVIKTLEGLPYAVEAYPNPTDDLLLIQLKKTEIKDFQFVLYNVNGKVLKQEPLASDVTGINMDSYPAGVYLLKIMRLDKEIKTFEIIKH